MAPELELDGEGLTPFRIALVYVIVGGAWIIFTDQLLATLPLDDATVTQLQTGKGWAFVGVSGLLIYLLVSRSRHSLEAANERLRKTLQHSSVVHRVLRHNIRNLSTVVELNAETLAERADATGSEEHRAIQRSVDRVRNLGTKARELRTLGQSDAGESTDLDLVTVVEEEVETFRERYPDLTVTLDLPEEARVQVHKRFSLAVAELLENAALHTDAGTVEVGITTLGDEVHLDVADDGPGMPEMERDVLENGTERPLHHSEGLGLWLVRLLVTQSGGSLRVVDNEPAGTVVRLTLDSASADRQHV